jgi:uncharacterized protein YecA (UPF0149 family)
LLLVKKPCFRPEDDEAPEASDMEEAEGTVAAATAKAGRNDPCPCGSGKKFKKCCGA